MRILLDKSEEAASFQVKLQPPSKQFTIEIIGSAQRNPAATPVDGKVGVTAMVGMTVPLTEAGRYVVSIMLEEDDDGI